MHPLKLDLRRLIFIIEIKYYFKKLIYKYYFEIIFGLFRDAGLYIFNFIIMARSILWKEA